MFATLIPQLVNTVVSMSSSLAFESAVKLAAPAHLRAVPAFALKMAGTLAGAVVAAKIAKIATTNTEAVIETLSTNSVPDETKVVD